MVQPRKSTLCVLLLLLIFTALGGMFSIFQQVHAQNSPLTSVSVNPTATTGNYNIGDTFTVAIYVANAPVNDTVSYDGFWVSLLYNFTILHVQAIDYSSGVLGSNAIIIEECIDGNAIAGACSGVDTLGVTTLALVCLVGYCPSPMPADGLLFKLTFQVQAEGFSEIHILIGQIATSLTNGASRLLNPISSDGYFTTDRCGSGFCTPPVPFLTIFPSGVGTDGSIEVRSNTNETLDASHSNSTTAGGTILYYRWVWGDEGVTGPCVCPIVSHPFTMVTQGTNQKVVTLTIWDNYGADASKSVLLTLLSSQSANFILSASTNFAIVEPGNSSSLELSITNLNESPADITLAASISPSIVNGTTATLNQSSVTVMAHGTSSITLTLSTLATTPLGHYTVTITASQEALTLYLNIAAAVVQQPSFIGPKIFWTHHLSITKTNGIQVWIAKIFNPNPSQSLWISLGISGACETGGGSAAITLDSGPVMMPENQTTTLKLTYSFSPNLIAFTIAFTSSIQYGLNPRALTETSTSTKSGTFSVAP